MKKIFRILFVIYCVGFFASVHVFDMLPTQALGWPVVVLDL